MTENSDHLRAALEPLVSRARTDATAIKGAHGITWTKDPLTEKRISAHLNGGTARGVCPIKAGESTTRIALFDLDSHKGQTAWKTMVWMAEKLCAALEAKGYQPVVFRSSGGNGVHVFLIWDEDQDAHSVRWELDRGVLWPLGFKNGAKGVAAGEIEVFPKQDSVPGKGFGNQFILPLAGKSAPLEPMLDYEVMDRDYALAMLPWPVSQPVPVLERPVRETHSGTVFEGAELNRLREALAAIPNDTDPLGYDEWRDVIAAIHHATGGSDEGHDLAYEFSSRAPHFEEFEFEKKVWQWLTDKGPPTTPVTERSIFAKAREHGWRDEARPEEFQNLTLAEPYEGLPLPAFIRDSKGRIEALIENVVSALQQPDFCGMDLRCDTFRDEVVYAVPGQPDQWVAFKDNHYTSLRCTLAGRGFKAVSREMVRDALISVVEHRKVDSAQVWLEGLTWDGVNRVDGFYERYFGVAPGPYTTAVSRYIWTAMAGRVVVPGCQADMVPILTGAQGLGKTRGVRAMVPDDTFRELSFHQSEETRARLMRGALMVELGELSGLRSREIETIKAWITRSKEDWVPKYVEKMHTFYRRCVIQGTTNDEQFLNDPTGARRWLPLGVGDVDVEGIARDRDQLWAEALLLHRAGGVAWQAAHTLAEAEHGNYQLADAYEAPLEKWLTTPDLDGTLPGAKPFTMHDALTSGLYMHAKDINATHQRRCAAALRALGFRNKSQRAEGKVTRWWVRE